MPSFFNLGFVGYGLLSQAHSGYGFLDSEEFSNKLFVPGFAASNNLATEACGFQIPELRGRRVHFLCIPNPVSIFVYLCVFCN